MLTYVSRTCTCAHLGVTQVMFLALAHLHTSRCYASDVPCTCTLAHISVLRNGCFLHLQTSRCYAADQDLAMMALAKLQRKWFGENRTHVGQANAQLREKNRVCFAETDPWENSMVFDQCINSFAMAKTKYFFKNIIKRWRGFQPDGVF